MSQNLFSRRAMMARGALAVPLMGTLAKMSGCVRSGRVTEVDPGDSRDQLGSVILDQSRDLRIVHVYHDQTTTSAYNSWLPGATGPMLMHLGDHETAPDAGEHLRIEFPRLIESPERYGVNPLNMPAHEAGGLVLVHHHEPYREDLNPEHTLWIQKHGLWLKAA